MIIGFLFVFSLSNIKAQTVEDLYVKRDFQALVKYSDRADELSEIELYYIGYAFFQLENDSKAIEMYDKAIKKGLDDDNIYLYKGLSLRFDEQYDKAIEKFRIAINRNPSGQKNYTELANSFYFQSELDSALVYFYKARELDFELGDPYLKIPNIYQIREDYKKALEEYQVSASLINKNDPTYIEILMYIGQLEYSVFKNYDKAIISYSKMLSLDPENYDLYPKLIKTYYAKEDYAKGDSLFNILKIEYEKGTLSDAYQKYGNAPIDEFEWNGQIVATYKYFKEPEETLEEMYKIYLLSEDGLSIERTFMTEKTIQLEKKGTKHLLCERGKSGVHHTYPYGWSTDSIDFLSLKKAVINVLNEEVKPSASSNFGVRDKKDE